MQSESSLCVRSVFRIKNFLNISMTLLIVQQNAMKASNFSESFHRFTNPNQQSFLVTQQLALECYSSIVILLWNRTRYQQLSKYSIGYLKLIKLNKIAQLAYLLISCKLEFLVRSNRFEMAK